MAQVKETYPDLLNEFPLLIYWTELKNKDRYTHYEKFSARLGKLLCGIKTKCGEHAIALYHKLGMCQLIIDTCNQLARRRLPDEVRSLYQEWFLRIYDDFSSQPDFYYDFEKPLWPLRKDLSVCSGRAIPVGSAWLVETRRIRPGYLSRSMPAYDMATGRVGQPIQLRDRKWPLDLRAADHAVFSGKLSYKLLTAVREIMGEYEWFYVIHTVERNIQDFTCEKMNQAYRNIAALLRLDPSIKGVFRASWFLDPYLKEISPAMSFLQDVPLKNGAVLYYGGACDAEEVGKATRMSPERSRLYHEGQYLPKRYFYIWPREKVIDGFYEDPPSAD